MRRLLLALPLALLPLSIAFAGEHDHAEHGSLAAHEHGAASLNLALDGQSLELELSTPAMNLLGFEHAPSSEQEQAAVATVRQRLEAPLELFGLGTEASCQLQSSELDSPLFGAAHDEHEHEHEHEGEHSDIQAHYLFRCAAPEALQSLDLAGFFRTFPHTEKLQVQLIGPGGQDARTLSAQDARLPLR